MAGKPEVTPYYEHDLGVLEGLGTGSFTSLNYQILGFESDIPELTLEHNTTYWITVASMTEATFTWENGAGTIVGSNQYARYSDTGQWAGQFGGPPLDRVDNAFALSGFEIPEPFTFVMLAVAVGVATIVPRRRRG